MSTADSLSLRAGSPHCTPRIDLQQCAGPRLCTSCNPRLHRPRKTTAHKKIQQAGSQDCTHCIDWQLCGRPAPCKSCTQFLDPRCKSMLRKSLALEHALDCTQHIDRLLSAEPEACICCTQSRHQFHTAMPGKLYRPLAHSHCCMLYTDCFLFAALEPGISCTTLSNQ